MRFWERLGIGIMSLWFLFATHQGVNALIRAHNWQMMSISDWGTWVGSIGTVATLIGTIWLATATDRQRKREQLDLALVATAGLVLRLKNVQRALGLVAGRMSEPFDESDDPNAALSQWFEIVATPDLWQAEELAPLVYLPNQVAANLAFIGNNIRSTMLTLKRLSAHGNLSWQIVESVANTISQQLRSNVESIDIPYDECVKFLVAHGFRTAWDGDEVHLPSRDN
jgi:hypothetical protein